MDSKFGKIACLFPGQGSQSVGMGKDLYDNHEEAKQAFERIDAAAGRSLSQLSFEGPEADLKRTINTQPTIMAVSLAAWAAYKKASGPAPDFVAGHSLGEITALVAAGVLTMDDAVKLVSKRAALMEECPPGAMAAVLKVDPAKLAEIVAGVSKQRQESGESVDCSVCVMANYNTREQLVISGNPDAVKEAGRRAKEAGGKAIPLPVGGAFHSPLMHAAAIEFATVLSQCDLRDAVCDVVQNFDAKGTRSTSDIHAKLEQQMENPVRWYETVEYMVSNGVRTFVEIGPGAVLTGLVKKIDPSVNMFSISDSESLRNTVSELTAAAAR